MVKCGYGIDPNKCKHGERIRENYVRCYFGKQEQRTWEEHPERHSDFPIKPSSDNCQYPALFGKGLKDHEPYKTDLAGSSFIVVWPESYVNKKSKQRNTQ
jgi:hypothetical protein